MGPGLIQQGLHILSPATFSLLLQLLQGNQLICLESQAFHRLRRLNLAKNLLVALGRSSLVAQW